METIGYYLTHPQAIIYAVANALLYPVLVLELAALVWVVYDAGRFSVELIRRRRGRSVESMRTAAQRARAAYDAGKTDEALEQVRSSLAHGRHTRRFAEGLTAADLDRTQLLKLLGEAEDDASRRIARTRMLVRLGPTLGLMGTLIPISPALVALAQGDVQTLADNLVIAFSTTVVGLLIGAIAYVVTVSRDRIYTQEISDIEFVLETMEV